MILVFPCAAWCCNGCPNKEIILHFATLRVCRYGALCIEILAEDGDIIVLHRHENAIVTAVVKFSSERIVVIAPQLDADAEASCVWIISGIYLQRTILHVDALKGETVECSGLVDTVLVCRWTWRAWIVWRNEQHVVHNVVRNNVVLLHDVYFNNSSRESFT